MTARARIFARAHPYVVAIATVAAATGVFVLGRPYFAKSQWALLYLLIVALTARAGGAGPALLASVLSFLAWNFFFLPPYHTLLVADSQDWLALGVFLIVGLVVGLQTARLRDREARAVARERESALMAELSASLVSEGSSETMGLTLVTELSRLLQTARVLLFVSDAGEGCDLIAVSPPTDGPLTTQRTAAEWVLTHNAPITLPSDQIAADVVPDLAASEAGEHGTAGGAVWGIYLPVQSGERAQGVLVIEPADSGERLTSAELRLTQSAANLVAAFLERQRLLEAAARANALREADELKSSLLSSVSHELKTPLAALTATVSNLLEGDTEWEEEAVREELRAIVADVTRLNHSIGSLLDLSRLEAHAWKPNKDWNDLQDIMLTGLDALPVHLRGRVRLAVPADLSPVCVDFAQLGRAFQNLLENAVIYGGDTPVVVGAREDEDGVVAWVEDHGCGVADDEKELVFEKFYRGAVTSVSRPFGTGPRPGRGSRDRARERWFDLGRRRRAAWSSLSRRSAQDRLRRQLPDERRAYRRKRPRQSRSVPPPCSSSTTRSRSAACCAPSSGRASTMSLRPERERRR